MSIALEQLRIASPCPANWDEMDGDDRVRFCHQCQKNVYDLTIMSPDQVADLIRVTEGRFCGRIYQRGDGRALSADCPVGLARVRRAAIRFRARVAAVVLLAMGCSGYATAQRTRGQTPAIDTVVVNPIYRTLQRWATEVRYKVTGAMLLPMDD